VPGQVLVEPLVQQRTVDRPQLLDVLHAVRPLPLRVPPLPPGHRAPTRYPPPVRLHRRPPPVGIRLLVGHVPRVPRFPRPLVPGRPRRGAAPPQEESPAGRPAAWGTAAHIPARTRDARGTAGPRGGHRPRPTRLTWRYPHGAHREMWVPVPHPPTKRPVPVS